MKRVLALALILALALTACGGTTLVSTETEETAAETVAPAPVTRYLAVSEPLTWAAYEAIPVARADMTEDELRAICVSYMKAMTSIVWTPDGDLTYRYPSAYRADAEGNLHFKQGVRYMGVPYTTAATDLASFLELYDEKTGVAAVTGRRGLTPPGNNCGTAVFWAWQRVSSSIDYFGTRQMCRAHGCVPVGIWTYDETLTDFYTFTTVEVCQENGEDVMYASYAAFKPGDGMTMTTKKSGSVKGHARMVEEVHVAYRDDGTVDPRESFVYCMEQSSGGGSRTTADGVATAFGSNHSRYTFETLYQTGYLPVTVPELVGASPVQEASVQIEGDAEGLAGLANAALVANYCISRVDVSITDAGGKEILSTSGIGSCKREDQYRFPLSRVLPAVSLDRNLKKGASYTVTVTARLGNGETLTALSAELTYSD